MTWRVFGVMAVCIAGLLSLPGPPSGANTTGCAAPWPMYQHDPGHSAAASCSSIDPLNVSTLAPSWFVHTKGSVTATPSVYGDDVYVGDSTGEFYALDRSTGAVRWTFSVTANRLHDDSHHSGFGLFTSSPAVVDVPGGSHDPTVYFGGGATLYALDAVSGAPIWAADLDPGAPESKIEIESSPVVDTATRPPQVIVGDDDNGGTRIDETGIQAFNALTGALLWKYEPERDEVVHTLRGQDGTGDACGDVWSSPALDPHFVDPGGVNSGGQQITANGRPSPDGLVVFGTGNCAANPDPATAASHGDFALNAGLWGIDAVTGERVWSFFEPANVYDTGSLSEPGGGDDDFGASPLLVNVGATTLVVDGNKSGFVYGLDERDGRLLWSTQDAQPGQLGPSLVGSLGGAIGSPALGTIGGRPSVFLTSAIPLPLTNDGFNKPNSGYEVPCLDTMLPACPDASLTANPARIVSLHALDAASGRIIWQGASLPTYAAATFTNGVVFAPSTIGFSVVAYDAATGVPLWTFPLGAAPASGVSVAGSSIYLGTGTAIESVDGMSVPPQLMGVWSFSTVIGHDESAAG
jgi:polyvinyl alcohol dehydrogenase (cytochrome)